MKTFVQHIALATDVTKPEPFLYNLRAYMENAGFDVDNIKNMMPGRIQLIIHSNTLAEFCQSDSTGATAHEVWLYTGDEVKVIYEEGTT